MKLRVFETNKNEIYGNEKLLFERDEWDVFPSIGELVVVYDKLYRVADICYETFEMKDSSIDIMLIPEDSK